MKILVVCGAGASSTFVAQRLRKAAAAAGLDWDASAGMEHSVTLGGHDLVLVGPHLADRLSAVRDRAQAPVVLLPADVFADRDGVRTLALAQAAIAVARHTTKGTTMTAVRTVRIGSSHGLHARPAKLFAQAAKDAGIPVTIAKDSGKAVNAASILGVISLAVEHGDYVTLTADGDGAEGVLDILTELLTTDHDQAAAE